MRIAVISDIHGNFEAFKEVLADIDRSAIDRIVCLGDIIGYGPEPEESVRLVRQRKIPTVLGNHELAVIRAAHLSLMNELARESIRITRELVSDDTVAYCRTLPATLILWEALFVHGCPPDSATRYLFALSPGQLSRLFDNFNEQTCFVGHSHDLALVAARDAEIKETSLLKGIYPLAPDTRYIVNVGSVGQPRDGDSHAKYVIWDKDAATVEVRYVAYDIKATVAKILALGFPEFNATRLWGRNKPGS